MNRSDRPRAGLVVVLLASVAALLGPPAAAAEPPRAEPSGAAVVALGDSTAAGDGAGDYEPGTRGERGNWCHRSGRAYVHRTGLGGPSVNLACSGAAAGDVAFGAGRQHTEGSQAERLVQVARRHRIGTVLLQVGANDEVALVDTGIACVAAFLAPARRPCRETVGPLLAGRVAGTARAVEAAVRDVRVAMRRAGYPDGGYRLVLLSYAAPITEHREATAAARGCPYRRADAGWGRTVLFPALSDALRGVAERTAARFLDLSRATEGREACSHAWPGAEWQRRLTVDPAAFVHGGPDAASYHLAQESFHPNAAAHAEFGRCVGAFVRSPDPTGACLPGPDGRLHLRRAPAPASAVLP